MWCPIVYFDFYDIPRLFLVVWRGEKFLFDSSFDDSTDDYSAFFSVYRVPIDAAEANGNALLGQVRSAGEDCGRVPVDSVVFDPSRRNAVDDAVFRLLWTEKGHSNGGG